MSQQFIRTSRNAIGQPVGMSDQFRIDAAKRLVCRADQFGAERVNPVELKQARAILRAVADLPSKSPRCR